jgi:hypothetical protein
MARPNYGRGKKVRPCGPDVGRAGARGRRPRRGRQGAEPGRGGEGLGKIPLIFLKFENLNKLDPLSFKKSTYWLRLWRESHVEFGGGGIPEI